MAVFGLVGLVGRAVRGAVASNDHHDNNANGQYYGGASSSSQPAYQGYYNGSCGRQYHCEPTPCVAGMTRREFKRHRKAEKRERRFQRRYGGCGGGEVYHMERRQVASPGAGMFSAPQPPMGPAAPAMSMAPQYPYVQQQQSQGQYLQAPGCVPDRQPASSSGGARLSRGLSDSEDSDSDDEHVRDDMPPTYEAAVKGISGRRSVEVLMPPSGRQSDSKQN